jgi:protein TonB
MEKKKNPKADLEKSKSIFFLIGLIVAMGAVFAAFNVSTKTSQVEEICRMDEIFFEDDPIMATRQPEEKIEIKPQKIEIQVLNIVDDNNEIEDDNIFVDAEVDKDFEIDFNQTVVLKEEKEEKTDVPLNFASKMPVFPGGEIGLMKYISDHVDYPTAAREQGIEGKVYVRFCVTKFGTVDRVSIVRGADPILDKEALKVVSRLPKWQPGENGGRKVSVWYTVPINFVLGN